MLIPSYLRQMSEHLAEIVEYYEQCENAYRDAWKMDHNKQLNLGLWKKGTKNLAQALRNLNQELGDLIDLQPSDKVLDAGCGVGGTAIYFAQHFGASVHGITITPRQVDQAKQHASNAGLADQVQFSVMNFMQTDFPDESFDVISGLESICYAEPKSAFIEEAYRLLKPGGRLILAENLQGKAELNQEEYDCLYTNAFHGCKVKSLDTAENYLEHLKTAGFSSHEVLDYTPLIYPSIRRLRRFYYPAWLYNQYHALIGRPFSDTQIANTRMCYYLLSSLKRGLWTYGIVKAVK